MPRISLFLKLAIYIHTHVLVNNSHLWIVFSKLQSVLDEYSRAMFRLQIFDVNLIYIAKLLLSLYSIAELSLDIKGSLFYETSAP
jgi:hypothetical protein